GGRAGSSPDFSEEPAWLGRANKKEKIMTPPNPSLSKKSAAERWWLFGKIFFVGFLILVLFLPMGMIQSLITERNERQDSADWEVIKTWGREQTLGGPVLTVPYLVYTRDGKNRVVHTATQFAHFLPDQLKFEGTVVPEVRYRGIFKVPLYQVSLKAQGSFSKPDFSAWHVSEKDILWKDAFVSVGIPDMRAIREQVQLSWENFSSPFEPGNLGKAVFSSGMTAKVKGLQEGRANQAYPFAF